MIQIWREGELISSAFPMADPNLLLEEAESSEVFFIWVGCELVASGRWIYFKYNQLSHSPFLDLLWAQFCFVSFCSVDRIWEVRQRGLEVFEHFLWVGSRTRISCIDHLLPRYLSASKALIGWAVHVILTQEALEDSFGGEVCRKYWILVNLVPSWTGKSARNLR